MTASLCIHNVFLVTESGINAGGVLAEDGRITAILEPGDKPHAETVIDGGGRLLFPGFIDSHVHFRDPGMTAKEDFGTGSAAAACGGVTTVMCMPNTKPLIASVEAIELARTIGERQSHVNFSIQAALTSENVSSAADLWAAGISSFEINLSDGAEGASIERVDDQGLLLDIMRETANLQAPLGIYTGTQAITARAVKRLRDEEKRTDVLAHGEARPPVGEAAGIASTIELARETGAVVVYRQVTTHRGFELLRREKRDRKPGDIVVEVTPHHSIASNAVLENVGTAGQIVPPLREEAHRRAAVAALQDGTVDTFGSDHAPHRAAEKTDNPWHSRNGSPGVELAAAVLLHLAKQGQISYQDVGRVYSRTPAHVFGLTDRKGAIVVGADADLTLVDPDLERDVTPEIMRSKMKRSVLEGFRLVGWPVVTVLGGAVIAENFTVIGQPSGRFLPGKGTHAVASRV